MRIGLYHLLNLKGEVAFTLPILQMPRKSRDVPNIIK